MDPAPLVHFFVTPYSYGYHCYPFSHRFSKELCSRSFSLDRSNIPHQKLKALTWLRFGKRSLVRALPATTWFNSWTSAVHSSLCTIEHGCCYWKYQWHSVPIRPTVFSVCSTISSYTVRTANVNWLHKNALLWTLPLLECSLTWPAPPTQWPIYIHDYIHLIYTVYLWKHWSIVFT